jgi:hypothetical protein
MLPDHRVTAVRSQDRLGGKTPESNQDPLWRRVLTITNYKNVGVMVTKEVTSDNLTAALEWEAAGCSVIPIRVDGSKKPAIEWKRYQSERATREQITRWWTSNPEYGIAVICGAVSGGLELCELEARATNGESFDKIQEAADLEFDNWDEWVLGHRTYAEFTPSGGIHLLYRVNGGLVPGNTKIANNGANECLAETRGEGGYVIVAPSGGKVHSTGESWTAINGSLPAGIKTLPFSVRNELHGVLKAALDERPPPPAAPVKNSVTVNPRPGDETPGDHFERVTSWTDILEPHGWIYSHSEGRENFWVRPGKDPKLGHSASTGHANDRDRMYVWSSSAGLPIEEPMTKFYVYAQLNHGGDTSAAATELRRQGFGTDRPLPPREEETWDFYETTSQEVKRPESNGLTHIRVEGGRLRLTSADQFKVKRVRWVWAGRAAVGEITIIAGREGIGKSTFISDLAARLTTGRLEGEYEGQPKAVIYIASEDSWNHTICPRMIVAGADMSKIMHISIDPDSGATGNPVIPKDCKELAKLATKINAGAIMFDPLLSCIDDSIDVNKAQSLRTALEPLRRAAERAGCAIFTLNHMNKTTGGDMLSKIAGSRAFPEVARSVIGLARLKGEEGEADEVDEVINGGQKYCVATQLKNNLGRMDLPNMKYTIEGVTLETDDGEDSFPRLVFLGETPVSAEDASNDNGTKSDQVSDRMSAIIAFIKADWNRTSMATTTQQIIAAFDEINDATLRGILGRAKKKGLLESPRYGAWKPPGS